MGKLSGFPKVLSLEEQGWFSLGYYHQRAWDRAQAKARKEEQAPARKLLSKKPLLMKKNKEETKIWNPPITKTQLAATILS